MRTIFVLLLLTLAFGQAIAAPVRTPRVEAELVTARTAIEPGRPLTVALRLKAAPGWHTYWRNPGDSGEPTRLEWKLPSGYAAGPILWPHPERLPAGPLLNYGYEDEVFLLSDITVPGNAAGAVTLATHATWLVCNPERCIPEEGQFDVTLPVGPAVDTPWAAAMARTRAALPVRAAEHGAWRFSAHRGDGGQVELDIVPPPGVAPKGLAFYPYEEGKVEYAGTQTFTSGDDGLRLAIPPSRQPVGEWIRVAGVLVASEAIGANGLRAIEIDVPISAATAGGASAGLAMALLFAFFGGLILNLMPCVLPVLSIKVLGFAQPGSHRAQGLVYAAGVVISFWLLAGLLIALKAAGAELGWGFQLQSPIFVTLLALLFFVLALNLSGVFEFGSVLPASLAGVQLANRNLDAFLTGVLAVVVASPCTAPFMGAALGYALAQSAPGTLLVFTALGMGMALPYVVLAWHPGWLTRLPKPGAWMLRFKQFLAFPLYATVVWLAWVLGMQAGLDAVILMLAALVVLGGAAWLAGMPARRPVRMAALLLVALAVGLVLPASRNVEFTAAQANTGAAWEPWTRDRVTELVAQGKPVFVDFTAAWCVTCQVNKQLVLSRPDVEQAFRERGVTLVRADWTRRDAAIAAALAELGRNGIPVYVLYRPGREPQLLPEILTRDALLAVLADISA